MNFLSISDIVNEIYHENDVMSLEQKEMFSNLKREELHLLKPTLGKKIGNLYLLWNVKNPLTFSNEKMMIHPTDMIYVIINVLWEKFQQEKV